MKFCKEFCKKNVNINLVFTSLKIKNYFSYKDPIPDNFKSFLVYKFTSASCSFSYIGKTCHHFKAKIQKHIRKDSKSHIFKHLHSTATCLHSYSSLSFKIIVKGNSNFELKIKEALRINWKKLKLTLSTKSFISHLFAIDSVTLVLFYFCLFVLAFLFHLLFLLSLTLIIGIFYCLNYTSLLLHLITTHLVSHLSLSSIIFSISTLIVGIFYCFNYILLLLHLIITQLVIDFIINM